MTDIIHLKITGMSCKHCVMSATKALEAVDGVDSVNVTLEPGGAIVSGNVDKEELIAAVTAAGYEAEPA